MWRFDLLLLALIAHMSGAAFADARIDIAQAFLKNIYTGQPMQADVWLTKDLRTAEAFVAFGGLDAVIRQSTATAERHGGLKAIEILSARTENGNFQVRAKVRFNRDSDAAAAPGAKGADPMVWEMRVVREDGRWKLDM